MVDSMDMVLAIMATVSTTARGRLRLRQALLLWCLRSWIWWTLWTWSRLWIWPQCLLRQEGGRGRALLLWIWRLRICPPLRRILRQRILLGISLRALPHHDYIKDNRQMLNI